jgi:hypothetical protein
MHKEINIEKIKTLEKDLLDTVSEINSIISMERFYKRTNIYLFLRCLILEATAYKICNHILTRITARYLRYLTA